MKTLLKLWIFLLYVITLGQYNKTETKPFVSPANDFPPIPFPRGHEENNGQEWTQSEILIAMFLLRFDVYELLGLTDEYVAECIGRTQYATQRKGYRAIKKAEKNDVSTESSALWVFDNKSEEHSIKAFLRNLIVVSKEAGTEVEDYFIDRLAAYGEKFDEDTVYESL